MPKLKLLKGTKTAGLRFKVLISFEWSRKLLPKSKVGILVKGDIFTIKKEGQFTIEQLNRHLTKGYIRMLVKKKK